MLNLSEHMEFQSERSLETLHNALMSLGREWRESRVGAQAEKLGIVRWQVTASEHAVEIRPIFAAASPLGSPLQHHVRFRGTLLTCGVGSRISGEIGLRRWIQWEAILAPMVLALIFPSIALTWALVAVVAPENRPTPQAITGIVLILGLMGLCGSVTSALLARRMVRRIQYVIAATLSDIANQPRSAAWHQHTGPQLPTEPEGS